MQEVDIKHKYVYIVLLVLKFNLLDPELFFLVLAHLYIKCE